MTKHPSRLQHTVHRNTLDINRTHVSFSCCRGGHRRSKTPGGQPISVCETGVSERVPLYRMSSTCNTKGKSKRITDFGSLGIFCSTDIERCITEIMRMIAAAGSCYLTCNLLQLTTYDCSEKLGKASCALLEFSTARQFRNVSDEVDMTKVIRSFADVQDASLGSSRAILSDSLAIRTLQSVSFPVGQGAGYDILALLMQPSPNPNPVHCPLPRSHASQHSQTPGQADDQC